MDMYRSCFLKTWRVQIRHSRLGVLAVALSPPLGIFVLYLAQLSLYKTTHLERYTCGCKCLRRETFDCVEYDQETCGLMYSTAEQAPFCEVTQPPLWPAVLQVPPGTGSEARILYTGDDMEIAGSLMEQLLVTGEEVGRRAATAYVHSMIVDDLEDDFDPYGGDMEYMSDIDDFLDTTGALTKGLYDFGVVLGTSADRGDLVHHQMLVDRAFVPNHGDLYVLIAKESDAIGIEGAVNGNGNGSLSQSLVVVDAIAESIGNLTNKEVRPLLTTYQPYASLDSMRRQLSSGRMGGAGVAAAPVSTLAALDWRDSGPSSGLHVDIYVDAKAVQSSRLNFRWAQSINIAFNAYLRRFNESSIKLAGVKDMPRPRNELRIDFSILLGPLLTVWIMHIILPVELYHLVYEKERSLRFFQYIQGLSPAVYYAATWSIHLLFYALIMTTFVGLGYAFGIKMMVLNSFWVQLMFWLLWGSVITSFGFLISRLFNQKRSVILLSLLYTLLVGFVANVVLVVLIEKGMEGVVIALQSLIPSFCAFRGLYELSSYAFLADQTNGPGLRWSVIRSDPAMLIVLIQLAAQSVVIPLLALYMEREWLLLYGNRKRPVAVGSSSAKDSTRSAGHQTAVTNPRPKDDALEHYLGYLHGGAHIDRKTNTSTESSPEQVSRRDSSLGYYFFGGGSGEGHMPDSHLKAPCNRSDTGKDDQPTDHQTQEEDEPRGPSVVYHSIRKAQPAPMPEISVPCLAIHDKEIFCFLADDPACASSLLKMTHGLSRQEEGTILIAGKDNRDFVGALRTRIATVFNGDVLFEELTGMEHLQYYARTRLNQIHASETEQYISNTVEILELHSAVGKRVSTYSSGIRRRLSLAISLLGYPDRRYLPEVLLMHEPTRSMDPYSRKVLWRALANLRQKTAIIIATSNISEADSCDRIAVMKDGTPIFVGSPQHLIFQRGRFIFLSFTVGTTENPTDHGTTRNRNSPSHAVTTDKPTKFANQVVRFVKQHIHGAELLHNWEGGGHHQHHQHHHKLKFKVPLLDHPNQQTIDTVFRTIERARANNTLRILDYRVQNCNLEDVYLDMVS